MNRRAAGFIMVIIAAAALAVAWRQARRARAAAIERTRAATELAAARSMLMREREAVRRAKASSTALPTVGSADANPASRWQRESERLDAELKAQNRKRDAALAANPALQLAFEAQQRAYYREMFAGLCRKLNLTEDQQRQLVEAQVRWVMKSRDLDAIAKEKGPAAAKAIRAERNESDAAVVRDVQAILGPDAVKITREYSRDESARSYVANYGGLFSRVGEPLTTDQVEAWTAAIAQVAGGRSPDPGKLTSAQWDQVIAQSRAFLTPAQWELFRSTTPPGRIASRWVSLRNEAIEHATGAKVPGP